MVGSVSEQPSSQATDPIAAERAAQASSGHCQFYMARKRRFCTGIAKAGQQFCGNHLYQATGAGGVRVPCPANPKHDVPMGQLATHLAKCTDALYQAAMRAQPYFHENFNAGADEQFGPKQLQHRLAAAATAALGQTAAAEAAGPDATAAAVDPGAAVKEPDQSQQAAAAAATAAAVAAAARAMGLVPTGPDAAAVSAVAAEAAGSFLKGTAIERQAAAVALGHEGFKELLAKIDAAHAVLTAAHPLHSSKLASATDADKLKEHCQAFDKLMTFDAKHAVQNASIVGNLASAGLLQQPSSSVFLELGAGKAWLTAWLHMLHPDSNEFVLLDKLGNFNNKADRRLRHLNLTRVAVDLKDAALLPLLQLHLDTPGHVRYNGSSSSHQPVKNAAGAGAAGAGAAAGSGEAVACWNGSSGDCSADVRAGTYSGAGSSIRAPNMQGGLIALRGRMEKRRKTAAAAAVGVEAGEAATADVSAAAMGSNAVAAAAAGRQPDLPTLLPGQEQQQQQQQAQEQQRQQQEQGQHQRAVVPWVVLGKHLCGAATDFALRGCYNALTQQQQQQQCPAILPIPLLIGDPQQQQQQQQQQFPLQGLAIASCCHHRCGWMSYTGRDVLQAAAGITKQDFDIISWLTGWALCGHESAPGTCSEQEGAGADAQAVVADHGSTPAAAAAATLPLDDVSCPQHQHSYHSSTEQPAPTQQQPQNQQERQQQEEEERRGGWHPATTLTHQQRIQLGLKCKQLIDAGRCAWMQQKLAPLVQQPMQEQQQPPLQEQQQLGLGSSTLYVRRVTYIDESVSGENTLLVLGHS